jgi:hypothetical protein
MVGQLQCVVFKDRMWVIGRGGVWPSIDGQRWTQAVRAAPWLDRGLRNCFNWPPVGTQTRA